MADIAGVILHVVDEIREVAKSMKENDRQASRLSKRVAAIEQPVLTVKQGTKLASPESLQQLLDTLREIRSFLQGYARMNTWNRVYKRKSNASKSMHLGVVLTEDIQALHMGVSVDTWQEEDESDRLEDIENLIEAMKTLQQGRPADYAKVVVALKALQQDERSELKGWVEIDFDKDLDFEGSTILGSGAFGEVRTAKWKGADVAVKHLRASGLERDAIRALRKEVRVHSSLHFDFVVPLYAASTIAPHLCLVMELSGAGSLQKYLYSSSEPLPHSLQAAFLYDAARGMTFLHSKGILHRDLKSANVLVFANRRLKLCDFGLSKIKDDLSSKSSPGVKGTPKWMSPEVMANSPANERTDLYSFGVLCFEVATRTEPFRCMNLAQVVTAVVVEKRRPQIPDCASASPDVVTMMEHCWRQDPAERPDGFAPVVRALSSVVSRAGDPRVGDDAPSPETVPDEDGSSTNVEHNYGSSLPSPRDLVRRIEWIEDQNFTMWIHEALAEGPDHWLVGEDAAKAVEDPRSFVLQVLVETIRECHRRVHGYVSGRTEQIRSKLAEAKHGHMARIERSALRKEHERVLSMLYPYDSARRTTLARNVFNTLPVYVRLSSVSSDIALSDVTWEAYEEMVDSLLRTFLDCEVREVPLKFSDNFGIMEAWSRQEHKKHTFDPSDEWDSLVEGKTEVQVVFPRLFWSREGAGTPRRVFETLASFVIPKGHK